MQKRTNWGSYFKKPPPATPRATHAEVVDDGQDPLEDVRQAESKVDLRWSLGVLVAGVLRRPLLDGAAHRRCPRGSRRATAASRPSRSTSPPSCRCGSRRCSSPRATSSSRGRSSSRWTPSRSTRSWPRPRRSLAAAQEQLAVANAAIVKQKSEIELAKIEKTRSGRLVAERAGSQRELDVRTMAVKTTTAGLGRGARASCRSPAAGRGRRGQRRQGAEPASTTRR